MKKQKTESPGAYPGDHIRRVLAENPDVPLPRLAHELGINSMLDLRRLEAEDPDLREDLGLARKRQQGVRRQRRGKEK